MHPLRCIGFFSSSQRAFALFHRAVAHGIGRYVDAAERREKGMVCFIERKDKSFISNRRIFLRENVFIFRSCERKTKNTGTFFDLPLVSLIAIPLSPVALLLWGESGSCFLAPLGVRTVSGPSACAPSRMTPSHAGTRTRALRTQQVSTFLPSPITCNLLNYCSLGVKAFAFP